VIALCEELGRRAREAARRGEATFAVPEGAPAAAFIEAEVPSLRDEAEAWEPAGARYHDLVRLATRAVTALDARCGAFRPDYGPKASGELEPLLTLWPYVLALPTASRLSARDLVELRGFPVHPLGLVAEKTWADGEAVAPSEFFFHDLDHARFKVREDLLAQGLEIPDAYVEGSTLDPATGRHRVILPFARGRLGFAPWDRALRHRAVARRLFEQIDGIADEAVAQAADLLLFEIVHEKSFPLEPVVLARELSTGAHLDKLRRKQTSGFFRPGDVPPAVIAALPAARAALASALPAL
jgi:hypothetical protein